jgi:hypothetical protein
MSRAFGELLELELELWCHGLARVQGRVDVSVLHEVIQELAPVLREAVEQLFPCDLIAISKRLIRSSRCRVAEKEISFYLLSHLPLPQELNEQQVETLNSTIETVENVYTGAFERLKRKWNAVTWEPQTEATDLGGLSFPAKTAQT